MSLAVKVLGFDGAPFDQRSILAEGDRFIKAIVRLAIQAGSYAPGGLALDWSNGGGTPTVPSAIPAAAQGVAQGPSRAAVASMGPSGGVLANGGTYVLVPGTNPTNWLLKIFATAGTEYATGALGTDALTDTPEVEVHWAR